MSEKKANEENIHQQDNTDKTIVDKKQEENLNENQIKINIQDKEQIENNSESITNLVEKAEVLYLVYKGETQNIERPINNLGNYQKYINTINKCIILGSDIFDNLNKNKKGDLDFEIWADTCSKIMSIIRKVYSKYEDIKTWDNVKRLELAIIITYQIIFNYYYELYSENKLEEKDKKLIHYVFSDEGKLAFKCVCNATITLFNELDENEDGKIDCNEVKNCCCTPSKWCTVLAACIPKKK